jgi:hypothetical protein
MNPRENTLQRSLTTLTTTWLSWDPKEHLLQTIHLKLRLVLISNTVGNWASPVFIPEAPKDFIE